MTCRERTIAIYRSSDSYVVQSRAWLPDAVGGVLWFGPGAAHGTVYVPVLAGMQAAPDTLNYGWQGVYNTSTNYWANRRVLNYAQAKFSYMINQIRQVQDAMESASQVLVTAGELVTAGADVSTDAWRHTEQVFAANAWRCAFEMNRLFNFLLFTYADGYVNYWDEAGFHATNAGYPVWWLEAGNYVTGPPPVSPTPMQLYLRKLQTQHETAANVSSPVKLARVIKPVPVPVTALRTRRLASTSSSSEPEVVTARALDQVESAAVGDTRTARTSDAVPAPFVTPPAAATAAAAAAKAQLSLCIAQCMRAGAAGEGEAAQVKAVYHACTMSCVEAL
jgi:hypothetical protein